jgi:hypothetical protein
MIANSMKSGQDICQFLHRVSLDNELSVPSIQLGGLTADMSNNLYYNRTPC